MRQMHCAVGTVLLTLYEYHCAILTTRFFVLYFRTKAISIHLCYFPSLRYIFVNNAHLSAIYMLLQDIGGHQLVVKVQNRCLKKSYYLYIYLYLKLFHQVKK